ncbi:MAG: hypothetical protein K0S48_3931 [Ramlibacter sp.]|nr:hypothetical protein [Ramlibacter sp.]
MTQARMWRWLLAGLLSTAATLAQADDALWARWCWCGTP